MILINPSPVFREGWRGELSALVLIVPKDQCSHSTYSGSRTRTQLPSFLKTPSKALGPDECWRMGTSSCAPTAHCSSPTAGGEGRVVQLIDQAEDVARQADARRQVGDLLGQQVEARADARCRR